MEGMTGDIITDLWIIIGALALIIVLPTMGGVDDPVAEEWDRRTEEELRKKDLS